MGCALLIRCAPTQKAPAGYEAFSSLPSEQKMVEFRNYPTAKQVDFFIYEFRYVHPFHTDFAFTIAERGDEVIPYLISRMKQEEDERNKLAVLYIFKINFQYGKLHKHEAAMSEIKEIVAGMKRPAVKESAEEMLKEF
jgi:hypothetical protein